MRTLHLPVLLSALLGSAPSAEAQCGDNMCFFAQGISGVGDFCVDSSATSEGVFQTVTGGLFQSVWYEWTPSVSGTYEFSLDSSNFEVTMKVYNVANTVSCTDLIFPALGAGYTGGFNGTIPVFIPTTGATTVYLEVGTFGISPCNFPYSGTITVASSPGLVDADLDGFDTTADCDDTNPSVYPGAVEVCCNGVDDDCNGNIDDTCFIGTNYCTGAPNSWHTAGARMLATGSTTIADNCLTLAGAAIPPGETGLFFHAAGQAMFPFGDGFQCASGNIVRVWPPSPASCYGLIERPLDLNSSAGAGIMSGSSRYFQCWYRDPAGGPAGFNLSDGLEIMFQ